MSPRRLTALGLASILAPGLLSACADDRGERAAASANQAVFAEAYTDLATYYVTSPDPQRLTMDAVATLHVLDPHLSVTAAPDGLSLLALHDQAVVRQFPLPVVAPAEPAVAASVTPAAVAASVTPAAVAASVTPAAVAAWAQVSAAVAAWGYSVSPTIRDYGWDGLHTAMLEAATADLDPYTHYFAPLRAQAVQSRRDGYAGIGLSFSPLAAGQFVVTEVADDSPAAHAGVRLDDQVLTVDGTDTRVLDQAGLAARLHGPVGASVTLSLRRGDQTLSISIPRQKMFQPTVTSDRRGSIGVLRITRFNAGTAAAAVSAIRRLQTSDTGLTGWVLDLRGNPGGLLDQAIAVADMLLDRGVILSTQGRHPDSHQHYEVGESGILLPAGIHDGDMLHGLPLMVLVDGKTASSAEVLAGALSDNGRGLLVGTTTFGKGVVQTLTRLPDGGEMSITWSHILTPSGRPFDHQGLHPAICTAGEVRLDGVLARLPSGDARPPGDECPATDASSPLASDVAVALLGNTPLRTQIQARLGPILSPQSAPRPLDQPQMAVDGSGDEP